MGEKRDDRRRGGGRPTVIGWAAMKEQSVLNGPASPSRPPLTDNNTRVRSRLLSKSDRIGFMRN